jgi:hypothetical protein
MGPEGIMTPQLLAVLLDVAALSEGGLKKMTLSSALSNAFVMNKPIGHRDTKWDWLPGALSAFDELADLTVQLPDDVPAGGAKPALDFWLLAQESPQKLFIHLKCLSRGGPEWDVNVRSLVNISVASFLASDHRMVHVRPWNGTQLQQVLDMEVNTSRPAASPMDKSAGLIDDLVQALQWRVEHGLGVRAHEVHYKAQRLFDWAGPTLDFNHPPEDLRGVLEIVTPSQLAALREVAQVKSGGVRDLTLSQPMSFMFGVTQPDDGTPLPVLTLWLTEELGKMEGLARLEVVLPEDIGVITDLRGISNTDLSIHLDCSRAPSAEIVIENVPAGRHMVLVENKDSKTPHALNPGKSMIELPPRMVYLPAGAANATVSSNIAFAQSVLMRSWDGTSFQDESLVPVPFGR